MAHSLCVCVLSGLHFISRYSRAAFLGFALPLSPTSLPWCACVDESREEGEQQVVEGECVPCRPCPEGQERHGCTGDDPGVCEECNAGTFKPPTGSFCLPCPEVCVYYQEGGGGGLKVDNDRDSQTVR